MNVEQIIRKCLKDNGYDGLCNDDECGCIAADLAPCQGEYSNILCCRPGYKIIEPDGEWAVTDKKP